MTEKTRLAIYVVTFGNAGNKEAEDVRAAISFPQGLKMVDGKIEPSQGRAADYQLDRRPDSWVITVPVVNQNETFQVTILFRVDKEDLAATGPLKVALRGRGVVGETLEPPTGLTATATYDYSGLLCSLVPAAVTLQIAILAGMYLLRRKNPGAGSQVAAK
jgi:hypothetical protein